MVPDQKGARRHFKKRAEDQPGRRLSTKKVDKKLGRYGRRCGIYEWRARLEKKGAKGKVVYVGSTCRAKPKALKERILEYCRNGSHKNKEINYALSRKYELWVRVKSSSKHETAGKEEKQLLKQYDYAWNETNNGEAREIL